MRSYRVFITLPIACASLLLFTQMAVANCNNLTADANSISDQAKAVQRYESAGADNAARAAWNAMNHYALLGAHEFNSCDDTSPRLSYAVSFAEATAIGMHYGLIPWAEGTHDIGGALQIIDALPHSPTVEKEWKLVDRLYLQACGMHNAHCARRTY